MHKLSLVALLAASLAFSGAAFGQAAVTVGAGTSTSAAVGAAGVSVNADATTSASAAAGADAGTSSGSSAAAAGGASAAASGSSAAMAGSSAENSCGTTGVSNVMTGAIDAAALAAVTKVTVLTTKDCNLNGLAAMDAGGTTALSGNAAVTKAIAAAGYTGSEISGYAMDGSSLTVYVNKK